MPDGCFAENRPGAEFAQRTAGTFASGEIEQQPRLRLAIPGHEIAETAGQQHADALSIAQSRYFSKRAKWFKWILESRGCGALQERLQREGSERQSAGRRGLSGPMRIGGAFGPIGRVMDGLDAVERCSLASVRAGAGGYE